MGPFLEKYITRMESLLIDIKKSLRTEFRMKRQHIGPLRRKQAAVELLSCAKEELHNARAILSFSSLPEEIDTSLLNLYLSEQHCLILPKVEGEFLRLYRVQNPKTQLASGAFNILEPIAHTCEPAAFSEIDVALIPGILFDTFFHRIGYGKGFYDKLLPSLATDCLTIGVGFKEQLGPRIAYEKTDCPLKKLYLF